MIAGSKVEELAAKKKDSKNLHLLFFYHTFGAIFLYRNNQNTNYTKKCLTVKTKTRELWQQTILREVATVSLQRLSLRDKSTLNRILELMEKWKVLFKLQGNW